MRTLIFRPTAKINLTLRVGARREDGYHDVRTLMQSIALSDRLVLKERRGPFGLDVRGPGVPADRSNLVWRAAAALWTDMGRAGDPRDAHARLEKTIPAAAGLGGGSADAAAALIGLNQLWDGRRSRRDLARLAAGLGSDVPFFLHGGTVLAAGRGDELYPVEDVAPVSVIVIKPSFGVATADAYGWLAEDRVRQPSRAASRGEDLPSHHEIDLGWPGGPITLTNDLEGPVARRHREIAEMIESCRREGAMDAAMTGSGSAVFGLFPEGLARKAARRLQRPDWLVMATRTLTRREAGRRKGV